MIRKVIIYFAIVLSSCFLSTTFLQYKKMDMNTIAANSVRQDKHKNQSSSLETWIGEYSFSEYAPPNQNMFYSIKIFKKGNKCFAEIINDGFQKQERLLAEVNGCDSSIKLRFLKYLPDNMFELYKRGDVLITFKKIDNKLETNWGKIQPMLLKNKKEGKYFYKKS